MEVKSPPLIKRMIEQELKQLRVGTAGNRHAAVARILNVYIQLYTSTPDDLKLAFAGSVIQGLLELFDTVQPLLRDYTHVTWTANPRVTSERYPPKTFEIANLCRYTLMTWSGAEQDYLARDEMFMYTLPKRYNPAARLDKACVIRRELYGPSQTAEDLIPEVGGLACTAVAAGVMPIIANIVAGLRRRIEAGGNGRPHTPREYIARIWEALHASREDVHRGVRAALEAKQQGCTGKALFSEPPARTGADEGSIAFVEKRFSIRKDIPEIANALGTIADGSYIITFPPSSGVAGSEAVGYTLGFTIWTPPANIQKAGDGRQRMMVLYDSHGRLDANSGLATLFWWDPRVFGNVVVADYIFSVVGRYTTSVDASLLNMLDAAVDGVALENTELRKRYNGNPPSGAQLAIDANQAIVDAKTASENGTSFAVFKLKNVVSL
jgi:hypothetical protein